MDYTKERDFLLKYMEEGFLAIAKNGPSLIRQKSAHDLVTEVDVEMETYLSGKIKEHFPQDHIHGEELTSSEKIQGRTWTVDPIDGTCNMARDIPMYGVQCALLDGGEVVVSAVYLPFQEQMIWAVKDGGCWCNGERVFVNKQTKLQNAVISLGDFTRKSDALAARHHRAMGRIYPVAGKIRMLGAACMDFAWLAMGKLDGTVMTTKNIWDLAPGILLCREAGAFITNLDGKEYHWGDDGVMISGTKEVGELLTEGYRQNVYVRRANGEKKLVKGCLFDFDGVVVDTESYHFRAWNHGALSIGTQLTWEEYLPLKSTGGTYIANYIMNKAGLNLPHDEMMDISRRKDENFLQIIEALSGSDILPGVESFLRWLREKDVSTAMASSSNMSKRIAKDFHLDQYFDAMFDGNTKMPRKPAPDVFLTAAAAIGVEPKHCIVFEDSLAGIDAAINAGMEVIAVGGIHSEKAMAHIQDFAEIDALFIWE